MRVTVISGFILTATILTACNSWRNSSVNPSNWFGGSEEVAVSATPANVNPLIPPARANARPVSVYQGVLIETVSDLRVERDPTGAIILATGIATRQGAYEARLIPVIENDLPDENGVLTYTFEVLYPPDASPAGSEQTRRVSVARSVSLQTLEAVRLIRVVGATNARETRRR